VDGATPSISNGTSPAAFTIGASNGASSNLILKGAAGIEMQTYNGGWKKYFNLAYTGDISFYEDTGTTPKFFWDASTESLGIGTSTTTGFDSGADDLIVGSGSASTGMTIYSGTTGYGSLHFADANSSPANYVGYVNYNHSTNSMQFATNSTERFRIANSGDVHITDNTNGPDAALHIEKTTPQIRLQINGNSGYNTIESGGVNELIFGRSGSEAMRLDASGNLLVGKTTTAFGTQGIRLEGSNGKIELTRNNNVAFAINRLTSDGDLMHFYKDGTTVGSIGSSGDDLTVGNDVTTVKFHNGLNTIHPNGTGSGSDGFTTLGWTNNRFKDLYLSGGVYLGGVGSSNKLDDYEEGTFTATLTGTTSAPTTPVTVTSHYTKIGRSVTVTVNFLNVSTVGASGNIRITGLPFTSALNAYTGPAVLGSAIPNNYPASLIGSGNTYLDLVSISTGGGVAMVSTTGVYIFTTTTYFV
jgi:hypothetical protein